MDRASQPEATCAAVPKVETGLMIAGQPLPYVATGGRKLADIPDEHAAFVEPQVETRA
jgi:hypothetical protein